MKTIGLALPTVHLGGTSKQGLLEPILEARRSVIEAVKKLQECSPHGRDFVFRDEGASLYILAANQHAERIRALEGVATELEEIATSVADATDPTKSKSAA